MYRGEDSEGKVQGGPMYIIREGLQKRWGGNWTYLFKPLAGLFAVAGIFGPLPIFQANQLTQILRDSMLHSPGMGSCQCSHGR
ncbi:MAG: alanine:cation symporter family protein [Fodinibius sp.]|nr:alanine:cation symporter family protein [Fodinibius sp.]